MNKLANAKRLTAEIAKGLANNGYDVKVDRLNDYATEITVEGRYKIGVTVNAGYPVVYNYLTGNSYGGDEYDTMNSMAAAMSQIMKNAIFRHLVKKPEGRTITVTLHPEDEDEEKTVTYTEVKTYGFVAGKTAKMIESHTDGSCIDKNHEYLVVVFRDLTETVFRRSSVVEVKEGNRIMVNGWDEDEPTAEEPQPTPEEADREVTYIDFKPEQDYSEEEPKVENSKVKAVAQYLSNKITGWYENARIDYGVNGKFLSCKAEGENGIRINWEENGKEYTMVINWFTEYTTEHLYNIWMEQGVEVEEVEKQPKEEEQQVVTIDNTQLFLKDFAKSLDAAGFATSYKELYQGTYSIHAIADQGVMVDVGFNEGVPCKTSASAVVYSGIDCIIIDRTKYNTETEFIKVITEMVISASTKEKGLSKATKLFESTDSTDNKVRKLRKEFKQWELLQEREKEADEAYEANYKNKELEKAADEAFEAEYKQYDKIARMIAELINVEVLAAKSMLTNRAERVKKILGL
jgi:hypothetical protein